MLFLHALLLFFLLGASPPSTAAILPRGPGPSGNLYTRDLSPRFVHAGGGCDCVNRKIPDFASAAEQDSPSVPKEHMLEGYWHPEDGFECFIHFDAKGQFDFLDPKKKQVRNGNRPFELGIYKRVTQEVFVVSDSRRRGV
ncbi:hypothetical protein AX14_002773 [Amanita brunnescens Koide BX004]|nr:hypothetical protein AX14_002773 [Amanita brunnescens Koide BX004]